MENSLLKTKKVKFGVYESALATLLFVIYNFLFLQFYGMIPKAIRANDIVSSIANFLLECTFAVAAITVALSRKVDMKKATGINKKFNGRMVWLGFLISIVCLFGFGSITDLFTQILGMFGYNSVLSPFKLDFFWQYLIYIIVSCVTPAFCEEFLFRGVILSGFKQYGAKIAIICSALIFTFMHGNAEQTVHQFIIGVVVGYIFYQTGNLWLGVIVHFFNNFISITSAFILSWFTPETTEEVVETATVNPWLQLLVSAIIAAVLAYFGYKVLMYLLKQVFDEDKRINNSEVVLKNETTISVDGKEVVAEIQIDGVSTSGAELDNAESSSKDIKKSTESLSVGTIVMFSIACCYLALEWISSLLIGFGVV